MDRLISNKEHNSFLKNGNQKHKPTGIIPSSLLDYETEKYRDIYLKKWLDIEKLITKMIGKPFYSDNGFILYNGDSLDYLKSINGSSLKFDLTLTSPPYNIGKEYENNLSIDDYLNWCKKWMNLIYETTNKDGSFWLNLGYFEIPNKGLCVPISYLLWDKSAFYLLQEIVWNYGAGVSSKKRLSPRNEKWLFYVKDPNNYKFNLDEIRDPNVKYPNQMKNGKFRCNPNGKNPTDVWNFPKVTTGKKRSSKERSTHPAQFPLGIVERVIKGSSNPFEIVFDLFSGSSSTGIGAYCLGRIFIGFEKNKTYCCESIERFEKVKKEKELSKIQLNLF